MLGIFRGHCKWTALSGVVAMLHMACGPAFAQSAQELNPAARAPAPPPAPHPGDLLSAPEPGPCPLRSSNLTFKLTGVTFKGAASLTEQDLAPAFQGLVGQDIPVSALCDIRDRASNILFDHNLFARVEIPEQKITGGQVVFQVIEAYIARVRVIGDDSPAQSKVEDYIEKLKGMRPFDLRKAQRYLFLAQDVPGVSIAATLKRGGPEPGAIELDITIFSRKPIDALVGVQNTGSRAIGPFGTVLRVDLNSLTSLGERTTLVAYQTLDIKEQRVFQAIEEVRLGDEGLLGRLSFSTGETHPGGALSPLGITALSYVTDAGFSFPLIRRRDQNVNLLGGLQIVDQHVGVAPGQLLSDDFLRVFYMRANGSQILRDGIVPAEVGGGVELRKGTGLFGGSSITDADLSRADGHPDALVFRGDAHVNFGRFSPDMAGNFFSGFSESLQVQGQYSAVPLLSYEQMAIGNLTIGRGYDPASLNGDSAIAGSAEVHWLPYWSVFPPEWHLSVSPYGFFDVAQVWNHGVAGEDRSVRSVGGGATVQFTDNFRLDGVYAHPMDKISSTAPTRPGDRFLVNLIASY